ncbi:MAG: DUF1835 domain-containing protein [Motiliproteus sp.]
MSDTQSSNDARDLHITNGDCTGEMLKAIETIKGEILCWRDLLHDGPVKDLPFDQYAALRAQFLWQAVTATEPDTELSYDSVRQDFQQRKQVFDRLAEFDQITLWFEHDLYDQLQLIEILNALGQCPDLPPVYLICIDQHTEVPHFHGLGDLNLEQLQGLYPLRQPVQAEQRQTAAGLWQMLTSDTPEMLASVIKQEVPGFAFMQGALKRLAEEYPFKRHGLTKTQWWLLRSVHQPLAELPVHKQRLIDLDSQGSLPEGASAGQNYQRLLKGPMNFLRIFLSLQELEEAPFMGDLWVQKELDLLCTMDYPLLTRESVPNSKNPRESTAYQLTSRAIDLMQRQGHWRDHNSYDLWRGGVHINADACWYWDDQSNDFCLGQQGVF